MNTALEAEHDRLLSLKPEGASHSSDDCAICRGRTALDASITADDKGATVADKTYSEDEYSVLANQVEELTAKVVELTAAAGDAEVDSRVAAAKVEAEESIAALQAQLDTATVEAETAKQAHADLIAYLEAEQVAAAEAAALEVRKAERVAQVKEIASFSDDYVDAHADRWASLPDEAFEATLEDWKAIASKAPAAKSDEGDIPAATALTATRSGTATKSSPLAEVLNLRATGTDIRTI